MSKDLEIYLEIEKAWVDHCARVGDTDKNKIVWANPATEDWFSWNESQLYNDEPRFPNLWLDPKYIQGRKYYNIYMELR